MSLKANYFKLGLFVIGAIAAGVTTLLVIGSGRWFQQKITMETYFDESAQGLDIGSKIKYRGVVIGEVTRITFTYVYYQLDKPMSQRYKYVMVEAQPAT
jgi:ABC-type transporter Mla subunit MlaD